MRVWTVNRPEDMRLLMERGVDAVITNDPRLALQVRAELGEKE